MRAFGAAYRNETEKLIKRRKYIVFIIIGVLICTIWAVGGNMLSALIGRQVGFLFILTPTPMGVLPFFLQVLLPLLIFMGVTDLITTEGAEHTMKAMIYRPIERWKLYGAKLSAVLTYIILYLCCIFFVSALFNQIMGRPLSIGGFAQALASYALAIPTLAVLVTFAAFVAISGRSSSLVMFLLVVIYMVMRVLPLFFPILSELLFTSFLGWHRLWIGVIPGAGRVLHMLVIVAGYGLVFFLAGSLVFDKREY